MEDDQCDLETLSALLEDSDGDKDDHVAKESTKVDYTKNVVLPVCQTSDTFIAVVRTGAADKLKREEGYRSEPSDDQSKNCKTMWNIPSEEAGSVLVPDGEEAWCHSNARLSSSTPVSAKQTDPQNVKELQDELAAMQERMVEIQRMLTDSRSTSTASLSSSLPDQKVSRVKSNSSGSGTATASRPASLLSSITNSLITEDNLRRNEDGDSRNNRSVDQGCVADSTNRSQDKGIGYPDKPAGCRQIMKRSLFGDDSDSDWEDLDGDKPSLSQAGREIKALLKQGEQRRMAHTASHSPSTRLSTSSLASRQIKSSESGKGHAPRRKPQTAADIYHSAEEISGQEHIIKEAFSNIRIVNPLVSCTMLASKMEGRRMVHLSQLHLKLKAPELQSDWVTVGVIVHKSDALKSSSGKTFCIWKLSDLADDRRTTSFFLFGQVYKQLWKTDIGAVLGILNPSIMDALEKNAGEVSFTVNNAAQVMLMGRAKDLGWCIGRTKHGNKCSKFINKKYGEYCSYHVHAAYRKTSAKRSELQGSCPGVTPKSFQKKLFCGGSSTVIYGGQSFTLARSASARKKDTVTLTKLQARSIQDKDRLTTMSIQDVPAIAQSSISQSLLKEHNTTFLDMLCTPTQGSMNLVRHIVASECLSSGKGTGPKSSSVQSVNAASLIKQHKQQMQDRIQQRRLQTNCGTHPKGSKLENINDLNPGQPKGSKPEKSSGLSPGHPKGSKPENKSDMNPGHLMGITPRKSSESEKGMCAVQPKSKQFKERTFERSTYKSQSEKSNPQKLAESGKTESGSQQTRTETACHLSPSQQEPLMCASHHQATLISTDLGADCKWKHKNHMQEISRDGSNIQTTLPEKISHISGITGIKETSSFRHPQLGLPVLGKGFSPGGNISIAFDESRSSLQTTRAGIAKLKAIEVIRCNGGITKVDPNSTKKMAFQVKEKVRKRLLDSDDGPCQQHLNSASGEMVAGGSVGQEPRQKKSRLLGGIDLNCEEVKRLLKAKSSHNGAFAEAEAEREEKYFCELEKKEAMEEKMKSITSLDVTVFTCSQCKYTALGPGDRCKKENHTVSQHKGKKRFFRCKNCSHRTVSLHRYPSSPCRKCGEDRFEKTSIWKEPSGPKLDSELLCLRGDEVKFLNSMESKVFFNT